MMKFRRTIARWMVGALFALLIASFALWGIGDIFRGGQQTATVIQVGEREISRAEFARMFQREMRRMRQAVGGDISIDEARRLGLVDRIVQQTITRALFDAQAREMGLVVSDAQVARAIRAQDAFRNAVGDFDRTLFQRVLRSNGLTEARFVEMMRGDIDRRRLAGVVTGAAAVPEGLAEAVYRYREERRVARTATIAFADVSGVPEPGETDLRTYYEEHGEAFMAPEYRAVSLVRLRPQDLIDEVKVDEAELRQAYAERKDELGQAERRRLRQVLVDDREAAARVVDLLRQGRTFDAAAREVTGAPPIDLGAMAREDMLPELSAPAFKLAEGEVSAPIETSLGWHVVEVVEVEAGTTPSFAEARDDLRRDIAMRRAVDQLISMANELDDTLAGGAGLAEAAAGLGLDVRRIPAIDRQGRGPAGEPVEGLPPEEAFLPVVFETASGQQSLLRETPQGGYFVLRVDGVTPAQRRPFRDVREKVRERWLAARREERAHARAKEIVRAVNEVGRDLAAVAGEAGLEVTTTQPVTRTGRGGDVPAGLAAQLFEIDRGEATTASTQDGIVVAQLAEVRQADPQSDPQGLARVRQDLRGSLQSDMLAEFAEALRARHGVSVNRRLLDNVVAQF